MYLSVHTHMKLVDYSWKNVRIEHAKNIWNIFVGMAVVCSYVIWFSFSPPMPVAYSWLQKLAHDAWAHIQQILSKNELSVWKKQKQKVHSNLFASCDARYVKKS